MNGSSRKEQSTIGGYNFPSVRSTVVHLKVHAKYKPNGFLFWSQGKSIIKAQSLDFLVSGFSKVRRVPSCPVLTSSPLHAGRGVDLFYPYTGRVSIG